MSGIDPGFVALPLTKLAATALQRAARLQGASTPTSGVERLRNQRPPAPRRRRSVDSSEGDDARLRRPRGDRRHLGLRGGRRAHRRRGRPGHRAGSPRRHGVQGDHPRAHRAGRRAGLPGRRLGLGVRRRPVRRATRRQGRPAQRVEPPTAARPPASTTSSADVHQVRENKFYADSHGTTTTQQRVRINPQLEIYGADHDTRRARRHAHDRAAGRPRLGVPHRRDLRLGRRAGASYPTCSPPSSPRLASRPAATTWSSTRSNLWLTIHESIGHATELDRALGYEANYAGTSFATIDKLGSLQYGSEHLNITGDRTVRARAVHHRVRRRRRRRRRSWDIVKDGVLVGYQTDRRMAAHDGPRAARPAARSPTRPATSRSSGWRTCRSRRRPTTVSTDDLIAGVERGPLRRRRQVLVDRHAALQLPVHGSALLRDRGRPAHAPGARRGLPGDHDGLLGQHGRGRRASRPGCSAVRSTAARPNPARSPRSATAARPRASAT